jgi:hypothetical protein
VRGVARPAGCQSGQTRAESRKHWEPQQEGEHLALRLGGTGYGFGGYKHPLGTDCFQAPDSYLPLELLELRKKGERRDLQYLSLLGESSVARPFGSVAYTD